ncbi:MAG: ATP-binding protein, partial [Anaerolineae bacterium]|nr:ATP-binding protein [Anaerolineae bacterium]
LAFSRNRALKPEINNVNDIIEKFTRFLSRTLGAGIELNIDVPDEDLYINVDLSQLENALLNLSINARDAMEQGGKITISAIQYHHGDGDGDGYSLTLTEGDYIKVSITDTGTGISSEDLQHVYEPFFTTKEVGKGSGLGLSMVYGFTQQSNGACHIKSTLGEGTTVSMYFPEIPESKKIEKAKVVAEPAIRGSEVILVVEDEPRVRRVTLRDLKGLGYKTLEAENAAVAKAIIESGEPIDLLFSDILMPGEMDGHMLGIWTEENYPKIKVVLTSGYSKGQADVDRDKAHPFPLVRKPYAINKLAKQIRATLSNEY